MSYYYIILVCQEIQSFIYAIFIKFLFSLYIESFRTGFLLLWY